jgi:hypothetical protein
MQNLDTRMARQRVEFATPSNHKKQKQHKQQNTNCLCLIFVNGRSRDRTEVTIAIPFLYNLGVLRLKFYNEFVNLFALTLGGQ